MQLSETEIEREYTFVYKYVCVTVPLWASCVLVDLYLAGNKTWLLSGETRMENKKFGKAAELKHLEDGKSSLTSS